MKPLYQTILFKPHALDLHLNFSACHCFPWAGSHYEWTAAETQAVSCVPWCDTRMDQTLSYKQHMTKMVAKLNSRNCLLSKLHSTQWVDRLLIYPPFVQERPSWSFSVMKPSCAYIILQHIKLVLPVSYLGLVSPTWVNSNHSLSLHITSVQRQIRFTNARWGLTFNRGTLAGKMTG